MKTFTILLLLSLSGCTLSWLNYLPSSSCKNVDYQRRDKNIKFSGECDV